MPTIDQYQQTLSKPLKQFTLFFLVKDHHVLLGRKKRGIGQGKWLGFGGKVEAGETVKAAAVRELTEESTIFVQQAQRVADLQFLFPHSAQPEKWNQEVIAFMANQWQGEPQETAEMKPRWFPIDQLPYNQMWQDSRYWLPQVLAGKQVQAQFLFDQQFQVVQWQVHEKISGE